MFAKIQFAFCFILFRFLCSLFAFWRVTFKSLNYYLLLDFPSLFSLFFIQLKTTTRWTGANPANIFSCSSRWHSRPKPHQSQQLTNAHVSYDGQGIEILFFVFHISMLRAHACFNDVLTTVCKKAARFRRSNSDENSFRVLWLLHNAHNVKACRLFFFSSFRSACVKHRRVKLLQIICRHCSVSSAKSLQSCIIKNGEACLLMRELEGGEEFEAREFRVGGKDRNHLNVFYCDDLESQLFLDALVLCPARSHSHKAFTWKAKLVSSMKQQKSILFLVAEPKTLKLPARVRLA